MNIYNIEYLMQNMDFFKNLSDKIWIYPTDTVYGIWTIFDYPNMQKINKIKNRPIDKMCSIISPNIQRIRQNYEENLKNLKNPIDSIEKLSENISYISQKYKKWTIVLDYQKPWVRMIDHPFQKFVEYIWVPFISTSANHTGQPNITKIDDISEEMSGYIDIFVDWWILDGKPSTIFDLVKWDTIRD